MLTKGMTCSNEELDDLFYAEEPNDESYHDDTIEDQMNLGKTKIRQTIMTILILILHFIFLLFLHVIALFFVEINVFRTI